MQQALTRIEELLRKYGHIYEANLAAAARVAFERDPKSACHQINNGEWWNDSQSVAAIDLAINGGFTPQARQDARALREALIEMFTTMLAYDEHNETGELVVSQLRKWVESHV